ncbi:MAG TPA: hypothetical protein PLE75_04200 [Ferruginibacter sp.]|nr:hypothetical protein [Ferruginibacter sp.]HRO05866.1 hypothetical protein [Ferruginibacter sp.]HRO96624.1 hypothetical protein [Ferruginibacter sp.]HRP48834.1 hypothetical protein [Ferruginibacter sp.]
MNVYRYILTGLIYCILPLVTPAQEVQVSLNRNTFLIGEHIEYTIRTQMPYPGFTMDVVLPDSIPHLEILSRGFAAPVKDFPEVITQTITFTSFDSGQWLIPVIPVQLKKGNTIVERAAAPVQVNIGYAPEEDEQLKDIKPPIEAPPPPNYWPYYIAAAVLLTAIIAYILYRYFRKKSSEPQVVVEPLTAYQEAMKSLEALQPSADGVKMFYSGLTDVFKRYMQQVESAPLVSSTTDEILHYMQDSFSREMIGSTAAVLRMGDVVKFAKSKPGVEVQQSSLESIRRIIQQIHQQTIREQ